MRPSARPSCHLQLVLWDVRKGSSGLQVGGQGGGGAKPPHTYGTFILLYAPSPNHYH